MIPKNHQQLKQISIYLLVIHCLRVVYLMQKKISLILIEAKTVEKFCENLGERVLKIINYKKKKIIP